MKPVELSARAARQGEIILRDSWGRAIFIAGLIGCVVLAFGVGWLFS